jgi:hypothetical protein
VLVGLLERNDLVTNLENLSMIFYILEDVYFTVYYKGFHLSPHFQCVKPLSFPGLSLMLQVSSFSSSESIYLDFHKLKEE